MGLLPQARAASPTRCSPTSAPGSGKGGAARTTGAEPDADEDFSDLNFWRLPIPPPPELGDLGGSGGATTTGCASAAAQSSPGGSLGPTPPRQRQSQSSQPPQPPLFSSVFRSSPQFSPRDSPLPDPLGLLDDAEPPPEVRVGDMD